MVVNFGNHPIEKGWLKFKRLGVKLPIKWSKKWDGHHSDHHSVHGKSPLKEAHLRRYQPGEAKWWENFLQVLRSEICAKKTARQMFDGQMSKKIIHGFFPVFFVCSQQPVYRFPINKLPKPAAFTAALVLLTRPSVPNRLAGRTMSSIWKSKICGAEKKRWNLWNLLQLSCFSQPNSPIFTCPRFFVKEILQCNGNVFQKQTETKKNIRSIFFQQVELFTWPFCRASRSHRQIHLSRVLLKIKTTSSYAPLSSLYRN